MRTLRRMSVSVTILAICMAVNAFGGEDEDKARAILERFKSTVVTVKLVVKQKFSMGGRGSEENESRSEATGTVLSPDGLVVVSLSATDPTSLYKSMMPANMEGFNIDSEVSDVKILTENGTEIAAQIVLRDNDLDLAYIRPLKPLEQPMPFADFSKSAAPQQLDKLISINRLGKVANRVYSVTFERVEAVVDKPRRFYIPGNDPTSTNQGCPAFTLDGDIVGLFVIRTIKDTGDSGGRGMFGNRDNILPVLLPAEDILEGAKQAPQSAPAPVPESVAAPAAADNAAPAQP